MAELWTILYLLLMFALLALHAFSLPANWLNLGLVALWKWTHPELDIGWGFVAALGAVALAAEGIEFAAQYLGAKKFGASGRGNFGGIVGAIVGAILGAPFLFGLGALFGALAGAYGGCLLLELGQHKPFDVANKAAWGAFFGKFLGLTAKLGLGASMIALAAARMWP